MSNKMEMMTFVKEIKRLPGSSEFVILEREEGRVRVDCVSDRHLVSLEPVDPARPIAFRTHETRYPLELIESIVRTKEFGHICDEMRRDEAEDYVERSLRQTITSYYSLSEFKGKRFLDFGCGMGASTMRLAQMLPETQIVGIELEQHLLEIAQKRKEFYRAQNITLVQAPSGEELPPGLGVFDVIMLSAVFEHLLPAERTTLLPQIWKSLKPGGVLFITETPHRWHFYESHTTKLLFLNYLPDYAALLATQHFCRRYPREVTWEFLLREGIRGGSVREILRILRSAGGAPQLLDPLPSEARDRIDVWFRETSRSRSKQLMRVAFKTLRFMTGITFVPSLSLAIRKGRPSA